MERSREFSGNKRINRTTISSQLKRLFRKRLLTWYHGHRRDLPWRHTHDPYAIWVSEIMLQQTQVVTVLLYYQKFLTHFPTVEKLAQASEESVLAQWSGLGYYRRAKLLHQGAKQVWKEFHGQLPASREGLESIPGIGPYTAGAIASIAYNQAEPLVDGNVIRVLSRVFAKRGHAKEARLQREIWNLAHELLDPRQPGDFNQALMELGATLCRSLLPACKRCPVQAHCLAFAKGKPEDYPETPPAGKTLQLRRVAAVGERNGKILLVKRKQPRWFQGMWELPHDYVEKGSPAQESLRDFLANSLGLKLGRPLALPETKHSITHHRIITQAWRGKVQGRLKLSGEISEAKFFPLKELAQTALPNFDRKVLKTSQLIA